MITLKPHLDKRCPSCGLTKEAKHFGKRENGRYLQSHCKACQRAKEQERRLAIYEDRDQYQEYRRKTSAYSAAYKRNRVELGKPIYIPMEVRLRAIEALI